MMLYRIWLRANKFVTFSSTLEVLANAYVATFNPEHEKWNGYPDPVRKAIEVFNLLNIRVGPKSSLTQTKLSEHETNRGEAEKSECVSGEIFEILGQAATAIEPREGALDNPASRQKLKPFGVIGAFDDFDFEVRQKFGRSLLKDWPLISAVSKELL